MPCRRPFFFLAVATSSTLLMTSTMISPASSFMVLGGGISSTSSSFSLSSLSPSPSSTRRRYQQQQRRLPNLAGGSGKIYNHQRADTTRHRRHAGLAASAVPVPDAASATTTTTTTTSTSTTRATTSTTDMDALLFHPPYPIEPLKTRIGHGFDIHRMAPLEEAGQPIVIGGVEITHQDQKWTDREGQYVEAGQLYETQLGVVAHSDGDVIYHSVVDAIFGALTLPDIGQVFQDTDPRWKGCDSSKFMHHAYEVMSSHGYQIGNVDVTLILERPKVASFKPAMKDNIIRLLHTTPGRVNIKARTHERVDSVGELRSLSCHVVLTLERMVVEDKEEEEK